MPKPFSPASGRVSPSRGAHHGERRLVAGGRYVADMRPASGTRSALSRGAVGTRPAPFACKPVNFHHEAAHADGLMHKVVNFTREGAREGAHGGRRRGARPPATHASPATRASPRWLHGQRRRGNHMYAVGTAVCEIAPADDDREKRRLRVPRAGILEHLIVQTHPSRRYASLG